MDSHRKSRLIGVSLLLFLCLAASAAGDNQCESISTEINSTFSTPCSSPIGICTTGAIASGLLKGTTSFTALSLAAGPAPATAVYTGTLSITTNQGALNIGDVGVLDTTNNVFSEIDRIESSTGIFFGAKGILFISGNQTATGFTGKVTGNVCLPSDQ
jgi:hypothetical protein